MTTLRPSAIEYAHFEDVMDWPWRNFTPREFVCRGSGRIVVVPEFMELLQTLRSQLGFPFIVTSGYRSPDYNLTVSTTGRDGPHTYGEAVDIAVNGERALQLIGAAVAMGFTGVGVSQKGDYAKRFVHLDSLTPDRHKPRPHIWSY